MADLRDLRIGKRPDLDQRHLDVYPSPAAAILQSR
jgi:hypothetical protein